MRRARLAALLALAIAVPAAAAGADEAKPASPAPPKFEMESVQLVLLMRAPTWKKLPPEEAEALQKQHIAHLTAMGDSGKMVVAGPFSDQADPAYRGVCIYRVGIGRRGPRPRRAGSDREGRPASHRGDDLVVRQGLHDLPEGTGEEGRAVTGSRAALGLIALSLAACTPTAALMTPPPTVNLRAGGRRATGGAPGPLGRRHRREEGTWGRLDPGGCSLELEPAEFGTLTGPVGCPGGTGKGATSATGTLRLQGEAVLVPGVLLPQFVLALLASLP